VTTLVEKLGEALASAPMAIGKSTSAKGITSSSFPNRVSPSRTTCGSAQMKVSATPRACDSRAAVMMAIQLSGESCAAKPLR
jgi:hypothetical protein